MTDLRYPIGKFSWTGSIGDDERQEMIRTIAGTPARLRMVVEGLGDSQLDTPYREGGWTVRQVVHHLPDSHLNAYCRMKLALTENVPVIKPYKEAAWAELADSKIPVETSLGLLEGLHDRWVALMQAMKPADFALTFIHPEFSDQPRPLDSIVALYSWHGPHHVAHVRTLRDRMGW